MRRSGWAARYVRTVALDADVPIRVIRLTSYAANGPPLAFISRPTCAMISFACPIAMFNVAYRSALNIFIVATLAGLWTISTNRWCRVSTDTRDHSKISDRPPACCASATTVPLNAFVSLGRRTMMRVWYGAPAAVPETKYSSVTYGKSSTFGAVATTLTAGFGYIIPGPET